MLLSCLKTEQLTVGVMKLEQLVNSRCNETRFLVTYHCLAQILAVT